MWNVKKWLINSLLILIPISGILWLQRPFMGVIETNITEKEYQRLEERERLNITLIKQMPSFGFDNLIANFAFLNFVQYYGDAPARRITGYSLVSQYFEAVVNKDPRFVTAYFFLEPANTLFAAQPLLSKELMTQGLEQISPTLPLAYQLWLYKGILQTIFLNDIQGAKQSYQQAANWARIENTKASLKSATIAESTIRFLEQEPDNRKITGSAWLSIWLNARDEQTKEIAEKAITELGGEIVIEGNFIRVAFPE